MLNFIKKLLPKNENQLILKELSKKAEEIKTAQETHRRENREGNNAIISILNNDIMTLLKNQIERNTEINTELKIAGNEPRINRSVINAIRGKLANERETLIEQSLLKKIEKMNLEGKETTLATLEREAQDIASRATIFKHLKKMIEQGKLRAFAQGNKIFYNLIYEETEKQKIEESLKIEETKETIR